VIVDMKATYLRVLSYLESEMEDDDVFAWILRETAARGIPEIQITPVQGRLLRLLVQLLGARRILEIGALSGYSGLWMARALPPDGKLITLEANPRHADLARESFGRGGVTDRVDIRVGPALETLKSVVLDAPLDMVFIDADKGNNRSYFEWALPHVRSGGLILVDNVLFNGRVDLSDEAGAYCRSIAAFNAWVLERYRDQTTIIPFYKADEDNLDGIMIVRVP
jgi:caffeoyl-CoA O-methyltransferase